MYHLYTEIKANLNDKSYIGLIDRLHPTPALGGYPKEEALDFIENKEFGTRGLYGAPVGYIDVYDDCEFIVAIRSMLIKEQQATLYAGCGIVKIRILIVKLLKLQLNSTNDERLRSR